MNCDALRSSSSEDSHSVVIHLPEVPPTGMFPVVARDIEGRLAVSPRILLQGDGSLVLPAYLADINVSMGDAASETAAGVAGSASRLRADGEHVTPCTNSTLMRQAFSATGTICAIACSGASAYLMLATAWLR
jgi:hypothetical protein